MPSESAAIDDRIDIKEAIRLAKTKVADLMEGEAYSQLGLEEVKYDDGTQEWIVTLGLNRPWNVEKQTNTGSIYSVSPTNSSSTRQLRTYKVVRLKGGTGELVAIQGRDD